MIGEIDWRRLADQLDTITWTDHGHSEKGGTKVASAALVAIIGDEALCDAVDFYLSRQPGFEVAKSVLQLLSPPAAMERCRERYRNAADAGEASDATELLRWVADRRVLDWMDELQGDENYLVRAWALGIIDQLWMKGDIEPDEGRPLVLPALGDTHEVVRSRAQQILDMWERDERLERARSTLNIE